MGDYAVINGITYKLSDKIVNYLKDKINYEEINTKKYYIGDIKISPNYREGYDTEEDTDVVFVENTDDESNEFAYVEIRKEELSGVIEALTEINDFLNEKEEVK